MSLFFSMTKSICRFHKSIDRHQEDEKHVAWVVVTGSSSITRLQGKIPAHVKSSGQCHTQPYSVCRERILALRFELSRMIVFAICAISCKRSAARIPE